MLSAARTRVVRNNSSRRRIHLVIDCAPTPELMALFPDGYRAQLPWSDVLFARPEIPLGPVEQDALRRSCR
ncbi:hypothetical protein ACFV30_31365 [Streptomyces sp. NPDC059752]|uniref:hypothetical protein n=1 Tax=unclassified Streptomyces TaxID=2593676 RepID=UPI003663B199